MGANAHPGGIEDRSFEAGDLTHIKKDLQKLEPGQSVHTYVPRDGETWFATGKLPDPIDADLSAYCRKIGVVYIPGE
jgi:hypothetical protein